MSESRPATMHTRLVSALVLAVILMAALALRLWGIDFGLPQTYHIDEPSYVRTALKLGAGILNNPPYDPTGFANMLFVEYSPLYLIGRLTGAFKSGQDFENLYRTDPSVFFVLSRLTSALLGTATVWVVYLLGKRLHSRQAGVLAAMFLAISFLHVRDSHYGTPDIAMSFFTALSILFCMRAIDTGRLREVLLAGIIGGIAIGVKWIAFPVCIPVLLAGSIRAKGHEAGSGRRSRLPLFLASCASLAIGGLISSPQIILNPAPYWSKVTAEYLTAQSPGFMGIWQVDTLPGWLFFLKTLSYGLGVSLTVLSIVGVALYVYQTVRRRSLRGAILLAFPVVYYLLMGSTLHYFARYTLPLVPFLAVFAAGAVAEVSGALIKSKRLELAALLGVAVLAIVQPLSQSVQHDYLLTHKDTRTLAKEWIEASIPSGAKIAMDWPAYGPPLSTPDRAAPDSQTRVYDVAIVSGSGLSDHSLDWYRNRGFNYLIASSFIFDIPLVNEDQNAQRNMFYAELPQRLSLVKEFRPNHDGTELPFIFDEIYGPAISLWQRDRPGPVIKVYQVDAIR